MPNLLESSLVYKPFNYPEAYNFWRRQQQTHWLPEEVPMANDVEDFKFKLTPAEVNLLTQIFRFFTQGDIEVNDCYHRNYLATFKPTEVRMMLTAFSNMETIHIAAYSHLIETLGMPDSEYAAFLQYEDMKAKHDYLQTFSMDDPTDIARTMAVFGGFTEGLQLFASFAILLNFPRHNKMKGMGQIVTWSVRDETLHCEGIMWLYHKFLQEHPEINRAKLHQSIKDECYCVVEQEDKFVDLAFELGEVDGVSARDIKDYIRYIADMRLVGLGMPKMFNQHSANPLPWLAEILNGVEHVNFFEQRATEYSKGATTGNFGDVWSKLDNVENSK